MKNTKWIVALLAVALAVGMVAVFAVSCGGTTDTTGGEETTSTEAVTTTDSGEQFTGDNAFVLSVGMPSNASLYNTYLVPWTNDIAACSNGRIEFEIYPANTLVKEEQQIDSVLNGTSDITVFQPDWAPGVYPLGEFGEMPGLFPDIQVAAQVWWDLMQEFGQEEYADFQVLGIGFISPAEFGGKVPAHVPADLQGKRLRSGGATETEIIEALGGTPVEAGTDSLATQLERNAFDGLFLSWSFHAGNTNNWATNWTEANLFVRPLIIVMAKDRWDALPAAVQQCFLDNSGIDGALKYLSVEQQYVLDNASVPGLEDRGQDRAAIEARAASLGTEIYVPTAAEQELWNTALEPVVLNWADRYSSKLDTQAVIARAHELIDKYTAGGASEETTTTAQ